MAIATRMAFGKELTRIANERDDFMVVTSDGKVCALERFDREFPDRGFCVGIAEQNMVGVAAGVASCGYKVFTATFGVFASMRALEEIRTFICYPNLNVTIAGTHAGLQVGPDGATHMALEDVAIMRSLPNMTIVQPCDEASTRAIVRAAVDFVGPLYIRLHRNPVGDIHSEKYAFEFGKAYTLRDYGNDAALVASGLLVKKTLDAAEVLKEKNIRVKVIECPTIKPLDETTILDAAKATGAIVTIEDHTIFGGLGSAVAETLSEKCPVLLRRIGVRDNFSESGDPELLYKENGMDLDGIVQTVEQLIAAKKR